MTDTDDTILDWLDEYGIAVPPKTIYVNLEDAPAYNTIQRRLSKLEDMGLTEIHPDTGGHYQITEKGERYLHDPDATIDEFMPDGDEEDDEGGDRDDGELEDS